MILVSHKDEVVQPVKDSVEHVAHPTMDTLSPLYIGNEDVE